MTRFVRSSVPKQPEFKYFENRRILEVVPHTNMTLVAGYVDEGRVIDLCFNTYSSTKLQQRKYRGVWFQVALTLQPPPLPLGC